MESIKQIINAKIEELQRELESVIIRKNDAMARETQINAELQEIGTYFSTLKTKVPELQDDVKDVIIK